MLIFVGYMIILVSVFGGFALAGGHLLALFQPIELVMIGGAALGAFLVGNSVKIIKATILSVFSIFKGIRYSNTFYVQLLSLLFEIITKIKKDGIISIEQDIETTDTSELFNLYPLIVKDKDVMEFLTDYLRLMLTGRIDIHQLESLMDQDIETYEAEKHQPIHAISKVADALPAFGIVAAVMGVVHTMESMNSLPPSALGGLIAKAMVGTFLGVLLAYGFTAPLAALIQHKVNESIKVLSAIKVVLLASVSQFAPTIAVEFGRKIIYNSSRPNGNELSEIIKNIKKTRANQ